jgi:hypothetical protein
MPLPYRIQWLEEAKADVRRLDRHPSRPAEAGSERSCDIPANRIPSIIQRPSRLLTRNGSTSEAL